MGDTGARTVQKSVRGNLENSQIFLDVCLAFMGTLFGLVSASYLDPEAREEVFLKNN